jgi:hypothetical protein
MTFDSTHNKLAKVKPDAAGVKINKLHKEVCSGMRTTLEKAIEVGKLLTAQKKKCGHGNWIPWIEKNLEFAERTARQYINCHKNQDKLKRYPDTDLTLVELARIADTEDPKTIEAELVKEPVSNIKQLAPESTYAQPVVLGGKPPPLMRSMLPVQKYLDAACKAAKEQDISGDELISMLAATIEIHDL